MKRLYQRILSRKKARGFTLLELLMVVIIIGILAALAVPQYYKTVERTRRAEALTNLGVLRSAVVRFAAANPAATSAPLANLDVEDPSLLPSALWTYGDPVAYTVTPGANPPVTFQVKATRATGPFSGAWTITMNQDGTVDPTIDPLTGDSGGP